MKLLVKNFGPIRNNTQTIDLSKKFYVFVGHNNSGKTYLSQLLWAVFNQDLINKFARSVSLENFTFDIQNEINVSEDLVNNILSEYQIFLKKEVANIFNIQSTSFAYDVEISFELNGLEEFRKCEYQQSFNFSAGDYKDLNYLVMNKHKNSLSITIEQKILPEDFFDLVHKSHFEEDIKQNFKIFLVQQIMNILLNHEHPTFFLPSSRQFYPTFYKYIYDIDRKRLEEGAKKMLDLVEENFRTKKNHISADALQSLNIFKKYYTEPMNYVFEKLYSLNQNAEIVPYYQNIIEKLIEIMGGNIVLKSLEGISPI